jgi:hypothetical protein
MVIYGFLWADGGASADRGEAGTKQGRAPNRATALSDTGPDGGKRTNQAAGNDPRLHIIHTLIHDLFRSCAKGLYRWTVRATAAIPHVALLRSKGEGGRDASGVA